MRIFINNVDSYVGKALCADLRQVADQDNKLFGTLSDNSDPDPEMMEAMGIKRIFSRSNQQQYLKDVLSCTLIVYDLHSADLQDVEKVAKQLKIAKLEHPIIFVLISSVNVWAKTVTERVPIKNEEEEEEEEEGAEPKVVPDRPEELKDTDLDRRTPAEEFESWKYLENLALSLRSKEKLRPHVVCSGILYGNGETVFNELFKAAWLTQASHVIIEPGTNYIPCVHVRDVARLVRVIAIDDTVGRYLLAVDKKRLTQAEIVQGIVNQISDKREVPKVVASDSTNEYKDVMMLDLIMQPSKPMRSKDFQWWSKTGLIDNMEKVAGEFCKWRNLRPIKMIIMGPPGSGAESFCSKVAERYLHEDPPHLTLDQIISDAMQEPTRAAEILRKKVAKLAEKPGAKLKLKVRTKLVKKRLLSNVCRYRGYVLEDYPTSCEEAEALFTEPVKEDDAEEAPPEEEEEEEEEEEDDDEDTHDGEDEEKKPKIEEIYAEDVNEDVDADDDEEDDEDYEPDEPEDDGLEDEDFDFDDTKGAEAPASSPARKRRRLVACSSSSQRKKRAEFPLDGLRAALEDAEHPVEGIPMSARHLLALGCMAVCAEARRTPVDSRQEVTTSALEMIGETLSGLHDTVKRLADEAREVARTAAGDVARKEQLQKAREACSSALRDARSDVSRRSQELGYCKEAIITARGSLRTAVQQAAAAEHKEQDCREDLDKVRGALKTFHALEADGAPAKAGDAKKMIKKVEGQMAKVGVFETLFARVALKIMPALQQNPDNRSSFDDSAISAAEGCFSTYIQEKGDKLEGLERASAGSRDRAHRAKTQIEQAKKKAEAARNAIRQAKEVRTDRGNALRAAIEAQTRHRQEVTDLVSKFKQRGAALADLEDLRQAFEALAAGTQVEPA
mmetsp:Transcript_77223/g.145548  ORF Transcript_77223/g.145548 Transcript_77223/m.145548 type:complete len:900 (+) Transcript_77223:76-2775(+)